MSISLSREMLSKYKNQVFVETGTYDGGGVLTAREVGIPQIYSIELNPDRFRQASAAVGAVPGVHLYEGDTVSILPVILSMLTEKATIWLDAHPMGAADPSGTLAKFKHPLMQELELIRKHSLRRDHTILVDDRPEFPAYGTTDAAVVAAIKAIDPGYRVYPEPGFRACIEGRIMVGVNP